VPGTRAYPDEPVLEERAERGVTSGTRSETVTLVAEGGGAGAVPDVTLDWFNLRTGEVETARAEGFAVSVDGPPAAAPAEPRDWRAIALTVLGGALALALAATALRRLGPPLRRRAREMRAAWRASEAWAWRALSRAVQARDHAALRPALDTWAARMPGPDPRDAAPLDAALTALGEARYGGGAAPEAKGWRALARVLPRLRKAGRARETAPDLPPLNPGGGRG
jgi:hypothetical protein